MKTVGLIAGSGEEMKFTERGKRIIMTMALAEDSKFEKVKKDKSYHEILASMNKRGKAGYRAS